MRDTTSQAIHSHGLQVLTTLGFRSLTFRVIHSHNTLWNRSQSVSQQHISKRFPPDGEKYVCLWGADCFPDHFNVSSLHHEWGFGLGTAICNTWLIQHVPSENQQSLSNYIHSLQFGYCNGSPQVFFKNILLKGLQWSAIIILTPQSTYWAAVGGAWGQCYLYHSGLWENAIKSTGTDIKLLLFDTLSEVILREYSATALKKDTAQNVPG